MNRQYHKWFSPSLGRDMETLVFGHAGMPLLVFPTSMGRFYEYEDRGMIAAIAHKLKAGKIKAYCVDSVDAESWYNKQAPPKDRIQRHIQYENYLLKEVIPFTGAQSVAVTGCSFGGYHAVNFALRHPDRVHTAISMGGAFDIHQFLNGYYDEDAYFNCPPDYMSGLSDNWYLGRYRDGFRLVLATGVDDICLGENQRLSGILTTKNIPHYLDVWGDHTGHDWPWWVQMSQKFF